MVRALKWAGIGIGGMLALGLLAALLLPSLVNLERYRNLLAGRLTKSLGREVRLESLQVSLWHGLGAEARGIQIAEAAGFGTDPFLAAEALRVHVQLLPLFKGQFRVTRAVLERPRLRLTRTQDGRWSFEDLVKPPPAALPSRPQPEPARPPKGPLLGALLLNEIAVRKGEITLIERGQATSASVALTDLDATLRQSAITDPIAIQSRGTLRGEASGRVELTGTIAPGEAEGPRLDALVRLADADWKGWAAILPEAASIAGPFSGEMRLSGALSRLAFTGSLDLAAARIAVGGAVEKPAGEAARLSFEGRREDPGLRVAPIALAFRDMTLQGWLHIPDLRAPHLLFAASSPRLDLDRLLAPAGRRSATRWLPGPGEAWAAAPPPSPAGQPRGSEAPPLAAEGKVRIDEVTYRGLSWRGLEVDLLYRAGLLTLPKFAVEVSGGRVRGTAEADFRAKAPRVSLLPRVEGVRTDPLVKAMGIGQWTLKSLHDSEARLAFSGRSSGDIRGSLSGQGSFLFREGQVIGYRPLERLAEVVSPVLASGGGRVRLDEFTEARGTYTVANGIVRTRDFVLTKKEGTVTAAGSLGLLDSSLDFDVVVRLGRTTVEARVTGTTDQPIVVVKLDRLQRKLETELNKIQPEGKGKGLKELFRGLFKPQ